MFWCRPYQDCAVKQNKLLDVYCRTILSNSGIDQSNVYSLFCDVARDSSMRGCVPFNVGPRLTMTKVCSSYLFGFKFVVFIFNIWWFISVRTKLCPMIKLWWSRNTKFFHASTQNRRAHQVFLLRTIMMLKCMVSRAQRKHSVIFQRFIQQLIQKTL